MSEITLILGLTGITFLIVRAEIFHGLRKWLLAWRPKDVGDLFTCPQCMGFWIGLFGGAVYAGFLIAPIYAGAVSLVAAMVDRWMVVPR